jgi:hypothetical protein
MHSGFTTAAGLFGPEQPGTQVAELLFVVAGTPTAWNPIRAFKQGVEDEPADRGYRIEGMRCTQCGFLEFYGRGE